MPQATAVSGGCPLLMEAQISLRFYFHVALGHGVTCDLLHRNGEQVGFGAVHLLRRVKDVCWEGLQPHGLQSQYWWRKRKKRTVSLWLLGSWIVRVRRS